MRNGVGSALASDAVRQSFLLAELTGLAHLSVFVKAVKKVYLHFYANFHEWVRIKAND